MVFLVTILSTSIQRTFPDSDVHRHTDAQLIHNLAVPPPLNMCMLEYTNSYSAGQVSWPKQISSLQTCSSSTNEWSQILFIVYLWREGTQVQYESLTCPIFCFVLIYYIFLFFIFSCPFAHLLTVCSVAWVTVTDGNQECGEQKKSAAEGTGLLSNCVHPCALISSCVCAYLCVNI